MDVVSSCPLRVASVVWQPRPGAWMLTVVCKATYALMPGESLLAPEQDEPNEADGYWNDEETRSLNFASDLAPFKRRADVLVTGHAFAPEGRPVGSLVARVVVGEVDKAIAVFGDRVWMANGAPGEPTRFTTMPLRWERAAGGAGTTNPVGVRMGDTGEGRHGVIALPNLQAPEAYLISPADILAPIGFGPIAPRWPGRLEKLYRHAAVWDDRWSERPLPEDVDAAFFNVAPADQQVGEIRSDERLVLENLHAEHARLVTRLARVEPHAVVERSGGSAEVRLRCDTLLIDTDRGCCTLVWRGQVVLAHPQETGRVVVTASLERQEPEDILSSTMVGAMPTGPVTPFEPKEAVSLDEGATLLVAAKLAPSATLPFHEGQSPLAKSTGMVLPRAEFGDGTGTVMTTMVPAAEALPFSRGGSVRPPPAPPPLPLDSFGSVPPSLEPERADVVSSFAGPPLVAPPPMIGPLATAAMAERTEALMTPVVEVKARSETPAVPEPVPLPLDEFSLARCAAIAASVARSKADAPRILEQNELKRALWETLDKYWTDTLREEMRRGKVANLKAYDAAYVGQLEKERGPLQVAEYARLVVANERGTAREVLAELTLPKGAVMRIERLWLDRMIEDVSFGAHVSAAIETAREDL